MFSSLRTRLWLSYALLIGTALGVVAVFLLFYLLRSPLLYRQTLDKLNIVGTLISTRLGETSILPKLDSQAALERADQLFDTRLILFDVDGQVILDSRTTQSPAIAFSPRLESQRSITIVRDSSGRAWLYSLHRLSDGSWLMVATPRPHLILQALFRNELLTPFLEAGIIALILSLFLAFWLAGWVAGPLQTLLVAAGEMPAERIQPVPERGPHEVRELTRTFNAMIARVQDSQRSQRDFVANVSHELKTPLTSVQGFAQAILDGTASTPQSLQRAAQMIYSEAGRMHRMVLDLLDLARIDSGIADFTMVPLDLLALLNGAAEKFGLQAQEAGVQLQIEAVDLPPVMGDGDRLAQVFTNLIDNALKHTPAGGQVTLEAAVEGSEVQVSVSDTGQGIPEEALPHIFERFYQVDASRSGGEKHGTGLGLAIAREIVQAHGGRITVRSQPGQGSTFVVRLPPEQPGTSQVT